MPLPAAQSARATPRHGVRMDAALHKPCANAPCGWPVGPGSTCAAQGEEPTTPLRPVRAGNTSRQTPPALASAVAKGARSRAPPRSASTQQTPQLRSRQPRPRQAHRVAPEARAPACPAAAAVRCCKRAPLANHCAGGPPRQPANGVRFFPCLLSELADKAQPSVRAMVQVNDFKGILNFSTPAVDNFVGNPLGIFLNR